MLQDLLNRGSGFGGRSSFFLSPVRRRHRRRPPDGANTAREREEGEGQSIIAPRSLVPQPIPARGEEATRRRWGDISATDTSTKTSGRDKKII